MIGRKIKSALIKNNHSPDPIYWEYRYAGHKQDFQNQEKEHFTTLSAHIWELKRKNKPYMLRFEIARRAAPFSPISRICNLCNSEKFEIIFNRSEATLNSRNELFNTCRHKKSKLLVRKKRNRMKGS